MREYIREYIRSCTFFFDHIHQHSSSLTAIHQVLVLGEWMSRVIWSVGHQNHKCDNLSPPMSISKWNWNWNIWLIQSFSHNATHPTRKNLIFDLYNIAMLHTRQGKTKYMTYTKFFSYPAFVSHWKLVTVSAYKYQGQVINWWDCTKGAPGASYIKALFCKQLSWPWHVA